MEDTETFMMRERTFSNGDVYIGNFNGALPQGKGKYIWADGTVYLGDWEEGKMTGEGQIIWPSGAKYEGDISSSYLNGLGELKNTGGSIYKGAWRMNINHGIGKKHYANLDIYEGSWKEGERHGCGHYVWNSGNSYVGNWKGGKMCGKGVMKYLNGDVFSGFWLEGFKHGCGIYKFGDGGYYLGTWNRGLKDGKGTFYPSGTQPLVFGKWSSLLGINDTEHFASSGTSSLHFEQSEVSRLKVNKTSLFDKIFLWRIVRTSGRISDRAPISEKLGLTDGASKETMCTCKESSCTLFHASDDGRDVVCGKNSLVYEKEYMQGVLMKERIRNFAEMVCKYKRQNKPSLKTSTKKSSVDIDEGHRSYYLMLNLQLGIRYTVGKITPVPMREVRSSDFGGGARIRMYFPRRGSQYTPPHLSVDFHWKDYCPMVFRNLREMFKLDAAEYMMSMCGDDGLRELSSPGKSGSIFYLSQDDRFVIKTLKKSELKGLLMMLPNYYVHVRNHENTLITKIFGLHRIKLKRGKKVRFVVMGNMFCTKLHIHRCYDLKGSTHGRFTSQDKIAEGTSTTLKDLDLSYEFHMDKSLRESLLKQISLDCSFLKSQKIIDYSLLLGLHFRAPQHLKTFLEPLVTMPNQDYSFAQEGPSSERGEMGSADGLILVTHEPSFGSNSIAHGPHIRGSVLKAYSLGDKEVDLLLPGTARLQVQLGVNMPAKATRKAAPDGDESAAEVELFEVYDVVLYMGIIDILQGYNLKKKLEHAYKSIRYDPIAVSVVEPELYAKRFIDFLENIFTF